MGFNEFFSAIMASLLDQVSIGNVAVFKLFFLRSKQQKSPASLLLLVGVSGKFAVIYPST